MTGFTPIDGALLDADAHRRQRSQTFDEVRTHLRHLDVMERLRWLAVTASEYRTHRPGLVHAVLVNGGDIGDIMWLTMDDKQRLAHEWVEWAQDQLLCDPEWDTNVYRSVAVVLDVVETFDRILQVRGISVDGNAS